MSYLHAIYQPFGLVDGCWFSYPQIRFQRLVKGKEKGNTCWLFGTPMVLQLSADFDKWLQLFRQLLRSSLIASQSSCSFSEKGWPTEILMSSLKYEQKLALLSSSTLKLCVLTFFYPNGEQAFIQNKRYNNADNNNKVTTGQYGYNTHQHYCATWKSACLYD